MMSFFKSALDFVSGSANQDNDFVGSMVELGELKLYVRRVIAEGLIEHLFIRNYLLFGGFRA